MTTPLRTLPLALCFALCFTLFATGTQAKEAPDTKAAAEPDPYAALMKDATVERGAFTSIQTPAGKHYLEIPQAVLGKDLLWYAEVAEAPAVLGGLGLGAMSLSTGKEIGHRAIRLEQRGGSILVRDLETGLSIRNEPQAPHPADPQTMPTEGPCHCQPQPLRSAISHATILPILHALPVVATSPDGAAVIDADGLFLAGVPATDPKSIIPGATAMDPKRSFVDEVRARGNAVETQLTLTYGVNTDAIPALMKNVLGTIDSTAATIRARHALMVLPENPMPPRAYDSRVGFFQAAFMAPSKASVQPVERHVITRFRLEKADPSQAVSDPVKPIVFYMSEEIPEVWRPYVRRGIEAWQPAFEKAGFRAAVQARPAPTGDPDWNPASLEHNVVRWIALPVKNAQGPKVTDPRTGEILAAHIVVWNEVIDAFADTYFLLASSIDEKARTLPLSEEIRGAILQYVITHEVGHSLGLRHNFRASQAFSIAELRDPAFTNEHGPVASVMSYGRMNYVAQPGDGVTNLMPQIGPYDRWAIHWGYAPIPGADSMEAELPTLEAWASEQATNRMLPYAAEDGEHLAYDPRTLRENLGDDRIESARLGIANLQRVIARLDEALASVAHGRSARIRAIHGAALDKRKTWLLAAAKQLYGYHIEATDEDTPRARARFDRTLRQATQAFLLQALESHQDLVSPAVAAAYEPAALTKVLLDHQTAILEGLLDGRIFQAAVEDELLGRDSWPTHDYLTCLRAGLFRELEGASLHPVDPVRRALQRHFVTRVAALEKPPALPETEQFMNTLRGVPPPAAAPAGAAAQARLVLSDLAKRLAALDTAALAPAMQAHVKDLAQRIAAAGIH